MLGLLGTVVGMIHIFDVMALQAIPSPKIMEAHIAGAILPTMAGMTCALLGMGIQVALKATFERQYAKLEQSLRGPL